MSALPFNPNETAFLLIDFQEGITELSRTVEQASLRAAAISLAKLARVFGAPTIVSTAMLEGPTLVTPEIENALGNLGLSAPARTTSNAFTHIPTADKIASLGRKTLLVAGVLTEVAVQHSALSGAERGYDVQVVVDACGGLSPRTEEAAFLRLIQAGVTLTSCASVAGQLMGDLTQSPTAKESVKILFEICQIGQSTGRRTR
jgi:nicotinamidase-related amidase